jgi:hypothetical protein
MVILYNSGEPQVYERATDVNIAKLNLAFKNSLGETIITNLPYKIVKGSNDERQAS